MRNVITSALMLLKPTATADDWPQWGGPQRDGVWRESGIVERLPDTRILPRVWSIPVGEGYSGPAVADGRVVLTDRQASHRNERILCLDAMTGTENWTHSYAARYTISYPAGPRTTPVIDDGRVYTIGAVGHMFCFDASNGDVLWEKNFPDDFGTTLPTWGMAAAPLVDSDRLINSRWRSERGTGRLLRQDQWKGTLGGPSMIRLLDIVLR